MKRFKNNKRYKTGRGWYGLLIVALMLIGLQVVEAQVKVPFEQRTSDYSPNRKIYNIKGDFEMIGNTNLTLQSYSHDGNNSGQMIYVDIDTDPQTINSSSATLTFSDENDAEPDCSNIIFAGLYWIGRAHTSSSSHTFNVNKSNVPGAGAAQQVNSSFNNVGNNGTISNSYYRVAVSRLGNNNSYYYRYTLSSSKGGQPIVVFEFANSSPYIRYSTDMGDTWTQPTNQLMSENSNIRTVDFDAVTIIDETDGIKLTIDKVVRDSRRNNSSSTSSARVGGHVVGTHRAAGNINKTLDKSKVLLKHASKSSYQTVQAEVTKTSNSNWADNIYFPYNTDGNMYSAYAEVTDYVRENGLGEYFVADIALRDGDGGNTGFFGGWGMVVVYENSKMKWRDITIFDGHAYVAGSTTVSHILEIDGFNTAQSGDVEMKLGLIAGEGDVDISGDYFQILPYNHMNTPNNQISNNSWVSLSHSGNSDKNFFNASIPSEAARNPRLKNNTGLDIAMFNIDNSNKSIITNGQTKTKFRYGSTQDTYVISTLVMAVDAYIPDIEVNNTGVQKINNSTVPTNFDYTVNPGDEVQFVLEVKNKGSEPVEDFKVEIPIPFSGLYEPGSATATYHHGVSSDSPEFSYSGTATRAGTLTWNVGDLPLTGNSEDVLATLTFTIKITDNCAILVNTNCTSFSLTGTSSGKGATSLVSFSGINFITGYNTEGGACEGEPILGPYNLDIVVTQDFLDACGDPDQYNIAIEYCDITQIPFDATTYDAGVRDYFPEGTRFWSAIEYYIVKEDGTEQVVAANYEPQPGESPLYVRAPEGATEYTPTKPFALNERQGPQTYYALPPGFSGSCFWRFTITVDEHCGNYWVGTNSTDWGTAGNWTVGLPGTNVGSQTLPNNVVFATEDNNKGVAANNDLYINADRTINNLTNDTDKNLVVTAEHMLKIEGSILSQGIATGTIIVEAHESKATGTLLLDPSKVSNLNATVQFYNKAYTCDNCGDTPHQQWQYFGIPVQNAGSMPFPSGVTGTVRLWDESAFVEKWVGPVSSLSKFAGYEINDAANIQPTAIYNFTGTLNIGNANIPLTYTSGVTYSGWNLIGNSFTAAIPITPQAIQYNNGQNFGVYLFNTGSRHSWRKLSGNTVPGIESGRYTVVPGQLGGQGQLPDRIPSMHAFMIKTEAAGTLTLDYSELTKNIVGTNQPAWRSTQSQPAKLPYIVMDVIGTQSADRVWLFENRSTTRSFDAGWDGEKMMEDGLVQLYVAGEQDLKLQVATVPKLQDTYLGLMPTDNENISVSFMISSDVEPRGLYLRDLLTGRTYPIKNNSEYILPGVAGENSQRFKVVSVAQGDESRMLMDDGAPVEVFVVDRRITVSNKSEENLVAEVYDISGRGVAKQQIERGTTSYINAGGQLPNGVYLVKMKGQEVSVDRRIMIR